MKDKYNITIERKVETFLFGLIQECNISGLYIIVLLIKKYISLCRSKSEKPSWENAKQYILYYRNVDMYSLYLQTPTKKTENWK